MIRKGAGEIEWLEFEIFSEHPGLAHGVFLRHGDMNFGDGAANIVESRRRILEALNLPRYVSSKQVHGNDVRCIENASQHPGDCDALITREKNVGLLIKHADCQAAIIFDPVRHALATVHAGWRGNVKNIYSAAVLKMAQTFGSKPQDLLVGVSPSLGPNHSEFINYKEEFPEEFLKFQVRPLYFDLWKLAQHQLEECGILSHHIQIAGICTYANSQDYFSFRRDRVPGQMHTKQNNATIAGLF